MSPAAVSTWSHVAKSKSRLLRLGHGSAPDMHSLAMACVGLVPRPIPELELENAGVVGRARVRISGTMPRRRARMGNSYSPLGATAILCYQLLPTGVGGNWMNRECLVTSDVTKRALRSFHSVESIDKMMITLIIDSMYVCMYKF